MAERIDPLPRIYDAENTRIIEIMEVIKTFCGITEENDKYPTDPTILWPLIWQVLRIISSITCWDDAPQDLFLTQTRLQTYPVYIEECQCLCKLCDDSFVIIPLEYAPHGNDFLVSVKISGMVNGKYIEDTLNVNEVMRGFDKGRDKFYINKQKFYKLIKDEDNCCACTYNFTVTLEYNAGYDAIPAGLLPVICYILNKVNNGTDDTDCHDNMTTTSGLLKRKKVGNVEYEWSTQDTTNSKTAELYSDLHDLGMLDEVLAISRCYLAVQDEEMGDVV